MHQKIALAHIIVCREHHHLPGPKRTPRGGFFGPLFASASLLDDDGVHCRSSSVNAVPTTQATSRTPSPISRCPSVFLKNEGLLVHEPVIFLPHFRLIFDDFLKKI
ncbi:MAG: hypothetical protein CMA25_00365 [Euryarchaeota archaeon]|nr:hypothetical protein [Euryarchaeota archaeon]